jgi:serine/threonine protein kinase
MNLGFGFVDMRNLIGVNIDEANDFLENNYSIYRKKLDELRIPKLKDAMRIFVFVNNYLPDECFRGFTQENKIGSGQQGAVFLSCKKDNTDDCNYVCKLVGLGDENKILHFNNEVNIQRKMFSKYNAAMEIIDAYEIHKVFPVIGQLNVGIIIMRKAEGDLENYLFKHYLEDNTDIITSQIIYLLDCLKDAKVMHRDLKLDNILVNTSEGEIKLFLTDFNLSKDFTDPDFREMKGIENHIGAVPTEYDHTYDCKSLLNNFKLRFKKYSFSCE